MNSTIETAVVVDGNSLAYRAYYATLPQVQYCLAHGIAPNNAIKLMSIMALKILREHAPRYALIAFDEGKKTFRNDLFEPYKANRPKTPPELIDQMAAVREIMPHCGYRVCSRGDMEADDVIGSFAALTERNGVPCKIFSSDRDMLQLVGPLTEVHQPKKGVTEIQVHSAANFAALNEGLAPGQIPDYKGIVGDSSDNLPGVRGIGKKTGVALILKYGSLESVFAHLSDLPASQQKLLRAGEETARLCKRLATIQTDLFAGVPLDSFQRLPQQAETLMDRFRKYKINNMDRYVF